MDTVTLTVAPPYEDVQLLLRGNITNPEKALILIHGRGSSAADIMGITEDLGLDDTTVVLAPNANTGAWYPNRFTSPREENEPQLSEAREVIDAAFRYCESAYRLEPDTIVLAGFSQGACLIADYIARTPQKYLGACVFSGGLIGSDEDVSTYSWFGSVEHTPVYIGCDEKDPHVPYERVVATASILERLEANVDTHFYTNLGHAIHPAGLIQLRHMLKQGE